MSELTMEQLWELRNAVLENAKRLTDEADLLLASGRWPAAFESAYFAREEAAKSAIVFGAAYIVAGDPARINWKAFWSTWRDHQKKSVGFVMMAKLYERLFEQGQTGGVNLQQDDELESEEALQLRTEREAALYVNWDGGIHTPWDAISEDRAREMAAKARKMVDVELASSDAHRSNIDQAASAARGH